MEAIRFALTACRVLAIFALQVSVENVQSDFRFLQTERSALVIVKYRCHLSTDDKGSVLCCVRALLNLSRSVLKKEVIKSTCTYNILGDVPIIERQVET